MASDEGGKHLAKDGNRTMSDYGARAGLALDRLVPGPNRDKAVERIFNCSPRMARYLRKGLFWTTDRLTQASRAIENFDAYIATPNLQQRLDALEAEIAELRELTRGEGDGR